MSDSHPTPNENWQAALVRLLNQLTQLAMIGTELLQYELDDERKDRKEIK